ncbi:ABC transporter ATP-binding protein [uncultured Microbacterium sp.]|uniref:ATP-binding cassette domain-containing protein n=1 Tax=uncultured Microbacterium sp. TaxID=191216 RepID=UPI00262FE717|nr:ABC transporter ATP-binding protein [uncultured Microbacterium sp.]
MSLIEARGLSRDFPLPRTSLFERGRTQTALHPTDLVIEAGESIGIIGESGSGKSTLVRLLLGLDRATAGTVTIAGRRVDAAASARSLHWLRRQTGLVFQDPYASLDPRMTAGQIIAEPLWALNIAGDRRARVREVLTQVHLDADMAGRYPHEFSGGQRQRLAIARAIVHRPRILVGDEPLSALDVTVRAQILKLLRELLTAEDLTLLLVSHDIGVVQNLSDTVAVMKDGRIVERGATADVLLAPREDYTRQLLAAIPVIDASNGDAAPA